MILAPIIKANLDALDAYLRQRVHEGKAFEGEFKFNPQHQDASKRFVYRVTLDNPIEKNDSLPTT